VVQEELSRPERIVVADVAVGIWPNMGIQEEGLAIFNDSVGVLQVSLTLTDGLHFSTTQGDTAFKAVEEEVVVTGGAVDSGIALSGGERVMLDAMLYSTSAR
jgi:hypothetical protein